MTALDAIKLGDFGLGVILNGLKDPMTYTGTRIYLPPVSTSAAALFILLLNDLGNQQWTPKCLENSM